MLKNPPAKQETQETQVQSLGLEDPLEEEMAPPSSLLPWENPVNRGAWWVTVHAVTKSRTQLQQLTMHAPTCIHICTNIYNEITLLYSRN